MKKRTIALALSALMISGLVGCGSSKGGDSSKSDASLKVGMVTDSGTIDDKSFNQGTWEGIQSAKDKLGIADKYLKPAGESESAYLTEIQNLYDAGYKMIITPGFKFESAIYAAQDKYKDAKFVIIDGKPNDGAKENPTYKTGDNSVAIEFAEHQSGFVAGVATALEMKEGDLGFIGGVELPAVQRFNWGYQQGVAYANENCGTNVTLKEENIQYAKSFADTAMGQQLAAAMYDRGVKAIFAAAGGTGNGVISEAKNRVANKQQVWVVGVDSDQYKDGVYDEKNNKSVILTSAIKKVDAAAYQMIESELNNKFPGGQNLVFDATNDAVGLPAENPNLSEETVKKANEVLGLIKDGKITVNKEQGNLFR